MRICIATKDEPKSYECYAVTVEDNNTLTILNIKGEPTAQFADWYWRSATISNEKASNK